MFQDIKVVELASVLAGPLVGTFFSELGADVLKIENKSLGGDATRKWKLPSEDINAPISAYYASANFGKRSLLKDLKNEEDYHEVMNYIMDADIVLMNFKPGDAKKLKLDYDTIQKKNPKIIYAEINGFGESNPRTAFDVVLQAETGFMYMNGEKDAKPLKMPLAFIDILAAHQLKEGILCALINRMKSGLGSKVEVSLYDAALSTLSNQATNWLMANTIPEAIGSQHPNIAPYGDLFQTKDSKWMVLAVGNDRQFRDLCSQLGLSSNEMNEQFASNTLRVKNRAELHELLTEKFLENSSEYLQRVFLEHQIPFGIVKNMKEVFKSPEAKQMILKETIEGVDTKRVKTVAFSINSNS